MKIALGQVASRSTRVTEDSVKLFVALSGDQNPIHTNEEYARKTVFGRRIAPGMQVSALFSAILANDLPGPGTIYLEQHLRFTAPIFIGDDVEAVVEVIEFPRAGRALLSTTCKNSSGSVVITGTALVKLPQTLEVT